ncbi:efflux RND transporter permease subunit [Alginatibacterium sediminis]|uniref:Efflux pump membrane transporter n=1 Tax=Alginatibacterium sediminis TaxID=2164068 RepID=A0A420ELI4_9ALTE|nr:efflux RND transporter permease subunit [Alginatibacterium sediminis]RKF21555.1 efflux RND transporter permease subunit [Alginatibacterium sediminis]
MIRFFIDRPKFAIVLSILMMMIGAAAVLKMPIALYPNVAPPTVNVFSNYRGANSQVVNDTVASVIEKQVNGVESMIYMRSNSGNSGQYSLNVFFDTDMDVDRAATLVQNRVNAALPMLPEAVKREGVFVEKVSPSMLMLVSLYSPDASFDGIDVSNYGSKYLKESLARINGLSKVEILGEKEYSMRVWLKPERLLALDLTAEDVIQAISVQNQTRSAGSLGAEPVVGDSQWQYSVTVRGRLKNADEFANIRLRTNPDGSQVRIKDVAEVSIGANQYLYDAFHNGNQAVALAIYQDPSANAVQVAQGVKEQLKQLGQDFPDGLEYAIAYDATDNIKVTIDSALETLLIAVLLVSAISWVFLGSLRATFIVCSAIPVSLIATFSVLQALGMSINTISLFGLILAIGIVVDAAIIVVETVEKIMHEGQHDPKLATIEAMQKVLGPLIASAAVLVAVFAPTIMMPGMVGIIFSQFGQTLVIAVIISTLVALTLTPALSAMLMKIETKPKVLQRFDHALESFTTKFGMVVGILCKRLLIAFLSIVALVVATVLVNGQMAQALFPSEDQGVVFSVVDLPKGASLERTRKSVASVTQTVQSLDGVASVLSVPGYNLFNEATDSSSALIVTKLNHWSERSSEQHQDKIVAQIQDAIDNMPEGQGMAFGLPSVPELGFVDGVEYMLLDQRGRNPEEIEQALNELLDIANQQPEIAAAFSTFSVDTPNVKLDINEERAAMKGVSFASLVNTINAQFGGSYVNDFTMEGRNYMVMVQAQADQRLDESSLDRLYVRNEAGKMLRVGNLVDTHIEYSPATLVRYNINNSALINAMPAPGYSSGDVIAAMERVSAELPSGFTYEWSGLSRQEKEAGNAASIAFTLAMVIVYLLLVAQYESWLTPLAILLPVPTAALGVMSSGFFVGGTISLYTQIALVLLIGMTARNSILIVEFAKQLREQQGYSLIKAATSATQLRMRAILMTALSFAIGQIPLMIASSAGAGAQQAIGWAAFGGIIFATFVGCLLVPAAFVFFQGLREKRKPVMKAEAALQH